MGALVAGHGKSKELADALLGFKEILLIAFLLNIGLSEPVTTMGLGAAVLLSILIVGKVALYAFSSLLFRQTAHTSFLASLSLANFSEFGLIVGAVAVQSGWLEPSWLVVLALALTVSFVIASPLNRSAHSLEVRFRERIETFESSRVMRQPAVDLKNIETVIFGMGRIGGGAYDEMHRVGTSVLGIDYSASNAENLRAAGKNVVHGDATDPLLWRRLVHIDEVRAVILATPEIHSQRFIIKQLRLVGFSGRVFAAAHYPNEEEELADLGAHAVYLYREAGSGLAAHVRESLEVSDNVAG